MMKRRLTSPDDAKTRSQKRKRGSSLMFTLEEVAAFFNIFEDGMVKGFLQRDMCYRIADKYLLAMTFVYFKRVRMDYRFYSPTAFFIALYLANCVEEEDQGLRKEILPWTLGVYWENCKKFFLNARDQLWREMGFNAIVSKELCEEVMALAPDHPIWRRNRLDHHGDAVKLCHQTEVVSVRGPYAPPPPGCIECDEWHTQSQYPDDFYSSPPC
ncbi:speedy protein A-like [Hyperolius riggenbachi]|uniref:speedy protein A-like n=1 Tax=Hyperolius riggenbachi TaxID=752182 RepID=UPI0035A31A2A